MRGDMYIKELHLKAEKAVNRGAAWFEYKGKDISFPRFRIEVYYKTHMAKTLLLTAVEYYKFKKEHQNKLSYEDWRKKRHNN